MDFEKLKTTFSKITKEVNKVVVGQNEVIEQIMIAILANSNALLESPPGLGKTLTIKAISEVMDLKFSRIQFTPDLMPSDVTGTQIIEEVNGKRFFKFEQGPIFANIVLGDEINRATPKTQSALLEAMQEKQVTVGNKTYELDKPFFVLATQNPIEQEGTYPLPEAQTDRFLLKILIDYPIAEEELEIINRYTTGDNKIIGKSSLITLQNLTRQVPISNEIKTRVVKIINATRQKSDLLEFGASPRASIGLILAAKARAILNGRSHVNKEDIDKMAYPILRHRIVLNFEAERKGLTPDDIIKKILEQIK
ncbi:MAG: AAA family ATPase [Nanoarchaeota archaeon]